MLKAVVTKKNCLCHSSITTIIDKKETGKSIMQKLSFFSFFLCYYYLKVLKLQLQCVKNRVCKTTREREVDIEKRKRRSRRNGNSFLCLRRTTNDDSLKTHSYTLLLDYLSLCLVRIQSGIFFLILYT